MFATVTGISATDEVAFRLVDQERSFAVKTTRKSDTEFRLNINITNFHARSQVPDGSWRIVPYVNGEPRQAAGWDLAELDKLDEESRTFVYAGNRVSYMVVFDISEDDVRPDLLMRAYQMFRGPQDGPAAAPTTKPPLKERIAKRVMPRARKVRLANRWYKLCRLINPPRGNRVLFASEMRIDMAGNLARVHERMVERGLDKQFKFRYSFRIPQRYTMRSTLRTLYLLATSDYVLIDDYFGMLESLQIPAKTKIIQVWHAGSGFKAIGYSRFGKYGSPKLQNAHRKYTYAITGSKHLIPVYAEAFGIEESAVIPTGLPRIDTFLNEERTKKVIADFQATYPHLVGKKLLLFAPTFRGRGILDAYYDYNRIDFAKLHEVCGDDAVVLFRMHHFIREPVPIPPAFADRLYDFSSFPDTNDLLHVTDVLITDYSSIIYEYALLNRPMLFFAYDKDTYSATRGFHRDFDLTAPGKVCETSDELVKAIQDDDFDAWKIEKFRKQNFDSIDTNAADRVIDWLILGDPHTSKVASSEAAKRDPATGDTAVLETQLSDQSES